jgi:hypothetical protein
MSSPQGDNEVGDYRHSSWYNAADPLGVANRFSVFGIDVTTNAHTNGNIAAVNINKGTNSGMNNITFQEVNYFQNISNNNGIYTGSNSPQAQVVVGKDVKVDTTDNGTSFTLQGIKLDNTKSIWQDGDTCFIDIPAELKALEDLSAKLSKREGDSFSSLYNEEKSTVTFNMNSSYEIINISSDEAGKLTSGNELVMKDYTPGNKSQSNGQKSVIFNVDLKGQTNFNIGRKIWLKTTDTKNDGSKINDFSERVNFQDGNILWNFYDSSKADRVYRGALSTNGIVGTLLAPGAAITENVNIDGNMIGNSVVVNAQSHRLDFQGTVPDKINEPTPSSTPEKTTEVSPTPTTKTTPEASPKTTSETTPEVSTTPTSETTPEVSTTPKSETTPEVTTTPTSETSPEVSTTPKSETTPEVTTTPTSETTPEVTTTPTSETTPEVSPKTTPAAAPETTPTAAPTTTPAPTPSSTPTVQKGKLTITVTDKKTGRRVPNAVVSVKDKNNVETNYKTNDKGQIHLTDVEEGDVTVTVKKVPKGYHVDIGTETTVTVTPDEEKNVRVKIDKEDEETVTDKKTDTGSADSKKDAEKTDTKKAANTGSAADTVSTDTGSETDTASTETGSVTGTASDTPETGDNAPIIPFAALFVIGGLGTLFTLGLKVKKD